MKLKIQEYADLKGVSFQNVNQIINNHLEELEDKIVKEGRTRYLTDQAQAILDQYINIKVIKVASDDDAEKVRLQKKVELLEKENAELKKENADTKNAFLRFENETLKQITDLKVFNSQAQLRIEQKDKDIQDLEEKKDKDIDLIATNRLARRQYKKEKKKKEKELKKQAKLDIQNTVE